MKKLLLLTLLCFSINGFAFNWEVFRNSDGNIYYVDVDNIKKRNGLVYYWQLCDWVEPLQGVNSEISKYKVDCVEEKTTWLNTTFYSQSMGTGKIIYESNPSKSSATPEISYPKPNSAEYLAMKFVCDRAK